MGTPYPMFSKKSIEGLLARIEIHEQLAKLAPVDPEICQSVAEFARQDLAHVLADRIPEDILAEALDICRVRR